MWIAAEADAEQVPQAVTVHYGVLRGTFHDLWILSVDQQHSIWFAATFTLPLVMGVMKVKVYGTVVEFGIRGRSSHITLTLLLILHKGADSYGEGLLHLSIVH